MADNNKFTRVWAFILAATVLIVTCVCITSEAPAQDTKSFPKGFEDYRKGTVLDEYIHQTPAGDVWVYVYDLTGDDKPDALDTYYLEQHDDKVRPSKYPWSYWFDLNGDNECQKEEIYQDCEADGWNGNENCNPESEKLDI
jgi:hypothetical protein